MSDGTRLVTDLNGRILTASSSAAALLAIDRRSLTGKPLAAFVAEDRRREFRSLLLELSHGGGPVGTSLHLRRHDGEPLEVEVQAVAEATGDQLEWLLASDAGALGEEPPPEVAPLEKLPVQRLLARLRIGVVSVGADLRVQYVNPAGRVFVRGASVGELLPEPLPEFSLRKFARRLFTSTPPVRQVVETESGRLLELDGLQGDDDGTALLLVQDVTTRERRRRAEQEFAANAAHELRTPIAAISSVLDVLEGGAGEVPADRERFLGHLRRETERLAGLVSGLLLLARIQTGQEVPDLRLVAVAPLLRDVAGELTAKEGVEVRLECPSHVGMLADAGLLRQVVWNLAANAASHTHRGEIVLSCRDLGALAEIEIRDTGSGMSEEQRGQAFDRFYRAQRRVGSGFGLGLPIAQAITRVLGGTLTLESELGQGTRVRVQVPSARMVA